MGHNVFLLLIFSATVQSVISFGVIGFKDEELAKPDPVKCRNRPREFKLNGKNYYYSKHQNESMKAEVGWLEARNFCRAYCMDTIAVNTQKEWDLINKILEDHLEDYIWTSGHECFKTECLDDEKFQPRNVNGFYWTLDNSKIPSTDINPPGFKLNPWSNTGHIQQPQPDNAEEDITGHRESCVAILHNVYNDGIRMHDVACYHKKAFICEDSPGLLKIAKVYN